ncbi:unnamed protein product, partial [Prorocentrum cordatum]
APRRSWASVLSFGWLGGLLRRGQRGPQDGPPVEVAEVSPPPRDLQAGELVDGLRQALAAGRQRGPEGRSAGDGLLRALVRLQRSRLITTGLLRFANTCVQFLPAGCVRALLLAIERGDPASGMNAALALLVVLSAKAVIENQFFYPGATSP